MMLKFNFKKIVSQRGIMHGYAFLLREGFSKYSAVAIMQNSITVPSGEFIEKFCLLFNCVPHDFMEWYPDTTTHNAEKQPLSILIPKENAADDFKEIKKLMQLMPIEKLSELKLKAEEILQNK